MTRIEGCDAVICVYDEAGNVIETHEHTGDFVERILADDFVGVDPKGNCTPKPR
jgi:hypothetical protein